VSGVTPVMSQLFQGQYHRHSNGFRSAAKDIANALL